MAGLMGKLATAFAFLFIVTSAFYLTFDVWIWTSGVALFGSLMPSFLKRRQNKPKLYGDSAFASEAEQRAGLITQSKSAF
jgi:hypothetical protein